MAHDLADLPRTGLTVQLCGDAHLSNFGLFAAPDRRVVFSINDFDETLPGPFEWDVARLTASFAVAGRDRGFDDGVRSDITMACVRSYREAMTECAERGWMDLWYDRLEANKLSGLFLADATKQQKERFERTVTKSRSKDSLAALAKLTHTIDGELRFVSTPPLVVPIEELATSHEATRISEAVHSLLAAYRGTLQDDRQSLLERYRYVHLARKVVGVGSVGTRAWIMLLVGRDSRDPLILQLKEAQPSVLEPFLGATASSNHGQRVVHGQRMMQAASDILLGWHRTAGIDGVERDFYVRQLWDAKGSADVDQMIPDGMRRYAKMCGVTLARAHARSGDPVAIASYLGSGDAFDRAMSTFAESYAGQNEIDHAALLTAIASGAVTAAAEPS